MLLRHTALLTSHRKCNALCYHDDARHHGSCLLKTLTCQYSKGITLELKKKLESKNTPKRVQPHNPRHRNPVFSTF